MKTNNNLSRSVLRVCLIFSLCLSLGVGALGFTTYTNGMMSNYQESLRSILTFMAAEIDGDDMEHCIETMETSAVYNRAQGIMDQIKETHAIEYIYIMKPLAPSGTDNMLYVMTGVTQAEMEIYPIPILLGDLSGDEYDAKVSGYYIDCMNGGDDVSYYANRTAFGYMYTGMLPIRNSQGAAIAVLSVDISIQEMVETLGGYMAVCLVGCLAFSALFLWILYRWMKKRVIRPIEQMKESASRYVAESHSDADPEKLHFDIPDIHTGDEIQSLSDTLYKMSQDVKSYMTDLMVQTKEKERIASELSVATQIQADMLPNIFPAFPERKEFDIFATMNPAKEVGGDFYDFFLIDDNHLAMVMADVSGKGVPAALFMVIAKTLIKNRAQMGGTPGEILRDVNNQLCEGNESGLFVTVWLAIVDLTTGEGIAANAGHEHPVLKRANGAYELVIYRHSVAVATMEGMRYRDHTFQLNPGDTLYVYTDGVPEATNGSEEMYGTDRLLTVMNQNQNAPLTELLKNIKQDIDAFVGDAPQFDDVTMLGMTFYGKQ